MRVRCRCAIKSSGPLRGHKGDIYEGGHRIPMLWRWDAALPAAATFPHLVAHVDLYKTLLSLAQLPEAAIRGVASAGPEPPAAIADHAYGYATGNKSALDSLDFSSQLLRLTPAEWPAATPPRSNLLTKHGNRCVSRALARYLPPLLCTLDASISMHTRHITPHLSNGVAFGLSVSHCVVGQARIPRRCP